jgi:hypothetical protein
VKISTLAAYLKHYSPDNQRPDLGVWAFNLMCAAHPSFPDVDTAWYSDGFRLSVDPNMEVPDDQAFILAAYLRTEWLPGNHWFALKYPRWTTAVHTVAEWSDWRRDAYKALEGPPLRDCPAEEPRLPMRRRRPLPPEVTGAQIAALHCDPPRHASVVERVRLAVFLLEVGQDALEAALECDPHPVAADDAVVALAAVLADLRATL